MTKPLWIMPSLTPTYGWEVYSCHMKVKETFRDLKGRLGLAQRTNKRQESYREDEGNTAVGVCYRAVDR